jgi:hypothetical protein
VSSADSLARFSLAPPQRRAGCEEPSAPNQLGAVVGPSEACVGREQRDRVERSGQLGVERVEEALVLAPRPCAREQARQWMALNRRRGELAQRSGHRYVGNLAGAMEAPERREHLSVEVRGGIHT